jgi:hypothetical protein
MHSTCKPAGGVTYADIAAATQPHDLAVPWGDVYGTGNMIIND